MAGIAWQPPKLIQRRGWICDTNKKRMDVWTDARIDALKMAGSIDDGLEQNTLCVSNTKLCFGPVHCQWGWRRRHLLCFLLEICWTRHFGCVILYGIRPCCCCCYQIGPQTRLLVRMFSRSKRHATKSNTKKTRRKQTTAGY